MFRAEGTARLPDARGMEGWTAAARAVRPRRRRTPDDAIGYPKRACVTTRPIQERPLAHYSQRWSGDAAVRCRSQSEQVPNCVARDQAGTWRADEGAHQVSGRRGVRVGRAFQRPQARQARRSGAGGRVRSVGRRGSRQTQRQVTEHEAAMVVPDKPAPATPLARVALAR
jgi:hypothetical protein